MGSFFDLDMAKNIVAELFGIVLTVALIDRLLRFYENRRDKAKWRYARSRVGERIGMAHRQLHSQLSAIGGDRPKALRALHDWAKATVEKIREVKREYSYAFTAEMAVCLEIYEEELEQTQVSIGNGQWCNYESLRVLNRTAADFFHASDVLRNDIEHLYAWRDEDVVGMIRKLQTPQGVQRPSGDE